MVKPASGYRILFVEVPEAVWSAIADAAEEQGVSMNRVVTDMAVAHLKIDARKLPRPKRTGRPPRRKP